MEESKEVLTINLEEVIARIKWMEQCMDEISEALKKCPESIMKNKEIS